MTWSGTGHYALTLACDGFNHKGARICTSDVAQTDKFATGFYDGDSEAYCRRAAKARGWYLTDTGLCLCPSCHAYVRRAASSAEPSPDSPASAPEEAP